MGTHPAEELAALVASIRSAPAMPPGSTIQQMREGVEAMMATYPLTPGVAFEPARVGAMDAIWSIPPDVAPGRTILWLHGGGYTLCSPTSYRGLTGEIARVSRARVLAVDYRLAPEHRFPAAAEDGLAAYRWLLDQGHAPAEIALGGDSAGGGLVVATLVAARDAGLPAPLAGVLISPWLDLALAGESYARNDAREPILSVAQLERFTEAYLGDASPADPVASPVHADLAGLPPLLVQVGTGETLLDDSLRLVARAAAADVRVTLETRPLMFHGWHSRSGTLQEATATIASIGDYLQRRFEAGPSWEMD